VNDVVNTLEPLILPAAYLGLLLVTLRVCATDARRRGKSPLLVTLVIFISFPLGLILWLLFRPEPPDGTGSRFRLEDQRVQ
jgi:hypothetical protein